MLYALHFVHLRADFPNNSPWTDWAKYTDEGWYGLAAIRQYQLGHWYLPGDFNPAVALPVWPLLEMALFRFTGVSVGAARALAVAIFGLILVCCYLLLRQWADERRIENPLAPAIAVLLLAANPFFFAFSRVAILEPLMVLYALLALLLARRAGAAAGAASGSLPGVAESAIVRRWVSGIVWSSALGIAMVAMVLTKTTGLFLAPAIVWMLWASCAYRHGAFLRAGATAAVAAACAWGGYMLLFVRPRYLADYHYLFDANDYTGITAATFWTIIQKTLSSVGFIGVPILWMAAAAVIASFVLVIRRRGDSLTASLLVWVASYLAFLAYHDNLSPRYYQTIGVALVLLIAMCFERFRGYASAPGRSQVDRILLRIVAAGAAVLIAFTAVAGATQDIGYIRHPEYTFVDALDKVRSIVERQPAQDIADAKAVHPKMVLSISGADLSLITGLPSICDDFGTMTLADRIATYRPGWYLAWNDVEDDKMEALAPMYRLVRAGSWPAFDDQDRNLLILYRLDPVEQPGIRTARTRKGRNLPRRLR